MTHSIQSVVAFTVLLLLIVLSTVTQACSCLPSTFHQLFVYAQSVDTVYILGQVQMKNGQFNGLVKKKKKPTDPYDRQFDDVHYLAYQKQSHKGCKGKRGDFIYYKTAGDEGACGVVMEPGWYVIGSWLDSKQPKYKNVNLCDLIKPLRDLNFNQKRYLKANSKNCTKP